MAQLGIYIYHEMSPRMSSYIPIFFFFINCVHYKIHNLIFFKTNFQCKYYEHLHVAFCNIDENCHTHDLESANVMLCVQTGMVQ